MTPLRFFFAMAPNTTHIFMFEDLTHFTTISIDSSMKIYTIQVGILQKEPKKKYFFQKMPHE